MNPRADKNKKRGKEKREPGSWEMDASSTAYHAAPQPSCRGASGLPSPHASKHNCIREPKLLGVLDTQSQARSLS